VSFSVTTTRVTELNSGGTAPVASEELIIDPADLLPWV
jgi:hypothetical protein